MVDKQKNAEDLDKMLNLAADAADYIDQLVKSKSKDDAMINDKTHASEAPLDHISQ